MSALNISASDIVFHEKPTDPRFQDITGQVFGRLTVIGYAGKKIRNSKWYCRCECGTVRSVLAKDLKRLHTTSCGCWNREHVTACKTKHGHNTVGNRSPEYNAWSGIIDRCYNKNKRYYVNYGGRGIAVCDRWLGENGFINFLADMGPRPSSKHSIDRINNDGPYSAENCRWATRTEQNRNQRSNRILNIDGQNKCVAEWSEHFGIPADRIYSRLFRGWSPKEAIFGREKTRYEN